MTHKQINEPGNLTLDKAINLPEQDCFGYIHIAQQLARSIESIGRKGSAVIGIEGAWGSGKTSLLNLLRTELDNKKASHTFVLTVSPWLDGDGISPVESLLMPVAQIIADVEEKKLSPVHQRRLRRKKGMTRTAETVFRYTQATARHFTPVAEIASLIPGFPNAAGNLKAFSETGPQPKRRTTAELRADIAHKIAELDLSFIILLDDLDRLEPAQAVEVIRLIKSVADFPHFRYILCYDRTVLSQAIKTGLNVEDGSAYLQKIIQLTFSLPRPESFDLRRQFLEGVRILYESVNGAAPDDNFMDELYTVTNTFGASLKTPREVQLALNGIKFRYEGIRDYVYLPDLCFLQLLRVTYSSMYDWVEFYLTERAVVESGDSILGENEQKAFVENLRKLLAQMQPVPGIFLINLQSILPGMSGYSLETLKLFQPVSGEDKVRNTVSRRLGSGSYWRYYFAFSSPQNVLPPAYFDELFRKAASVEEYPVLNAELLDQINSNGISSRTWFEHILSQLTAPVINRQSAAACAGLLAFFFNMGDEVLKRYRERSRWFSRYDLETNGVADLLLKRIAETDRPGSIEALLRLTATGSAKVWIANYVRDLLRQNGLAGNRPVPEHRRLLSNEELERVRCCLFERLADDICKNRLPPPDELRSCIWAWRDIAGEETIATWLKMHSSGDETFLNILLSLRSDIISSRIGHVLILNVTEIGPLLGGKDVIRERLDHIEAAGRFPDVIADLREAIRLSTFF